MNLHETSPAQVEHEARAKIFWGEPPENVFNYLVGQKVTFEEAQVMVDSMLAERMRALRGIGLKRILIGASLIAVPVVTYMIFASSGFSSIRIFGVALAVGLWGAWKVMKGAFLLLSPQSESGDVADL